MELTIKLRLDDDQMHEIKHLMHLIADSAFSLTQGVNRMTDAIVTGAQALDALTGVVADYIATDATSIQLDEQLITALQTEVALLTSEKASEADVTKIQALMGQLAAANAARKAANADVAAALPPVVDPGTGGTGGTGGGTTTPGVSTTTLTTDSLAVVSGAAIEFDGMVSGASPTGSVSVTSVDGAVSGSSAVGADGSFSVVLPAGLAAGSYDVSAAYGGDASNAPSTSPVLSVVVADAATA